MTATTIATANRAKAWDDKAFLEYTRESQFSSYMGTTENSAIQVNEDLTKKPADAITFSLVSKMSGANQGTGTLEGNEEALDDAGHQVTISVIRNAFVINNFEDQVSAFDIKEAGRTQLKNWAMDLLRDDILDACHFGVANYEDATAANHDTWAAANLDRVMYVGTTNAGDHTAHLLQITAADDKLSAAVVSLARRKARTASPAIKPIRVNGSEEWYVMFCDPYAMRDLRADSTIQSAQRDALARGANNPLFKAGDIIWDGVICREVPEIATAIDTATTGKWGAGATADGLNTAGASSARVGVNFLMGAQAIGVAYGKRMKTTTDTRDYGFVKGFGCEEFRGTEKLQFDTNVDHGMVTVYTASALD